MLLRERGRSTVNGRDLLTLCGWLQGPEELDVEFLVEKA